MNYVIGIDGGGTKTLLKLSDMKGNLLGTYECGPSNINSGDRKAAEDNIKYIISSSISNINETMDDCMAICIGAAGAGRDEDKKAIEDIIRSIGYKNKVIVLNDAELTLYSGTGCRAGVILISGTGSICYGENNKGESCRSGGWGHIIGDEGSGYYIGLRALNHVARCIDGREKNTLLSDMVLKSLGISNGQELIKYVYKDNNGKKEIAQIAKVVDEACVKGDKYAKDILDSATYELFICAKVVIDKLFPPNYLLEMAVNGGVLTKNEYVKKRFLDLIKESYPKVIVRDMKYNAAWGAVLISLGKIKLKASSKNNWEV